MNSKSIPSTEFETNPPMGAMSLATRLGDGKGGNSKLRKTEFSTGARSSTKNQRKRTKGDTAASPFRQPQVLIFLVVHDFTLCDLIATGIEDNSRHDLSRTFLDYIADFYHVYLSTAIVRRVEYNFLSIPACTRVIVASPFTSMRLRR